MTMQAIPAYIMDGYHRETTARLKDAGGEYCAHLETEPRPPGRHAEYAAFSL